MALNRKKIHLDPKVGRILVADPFTTDLYFNHAVILLGEHGSEGTIGFILNKPTDLQMNDALEDFPAFDAPLYFGGPVQTDTIHFLHKLGDRLEGSKEIVDGIFWGGDLEYLKILIDMKQVGKNDIRFFAGYCGWEPEQMHEEVISNAWIIAEGKKQLAFSDEPEDIWSEALKSMGSLYAAFANFPADPSLN
jgi:putative transcriptional regulator